MSTVQIIYEQFKGLFKSVREELKSPIVREQEQEQMPLSAQIEQELKEAKLIREGKLPTRTFDDLKRDMKDAQ